MICSVGELLLHCVGQLGPVFGKHRPITVQIGVADGFVNDDDAFQFRNRLDQPERKAAAACGSNSRHLWAAHRILAIKARAMGHMGGMSERGRIDAI